MITQETYDAQLKQFLNEQDGRFHAITPLPCLSDDINNHAYCPIYLYHTGWAARVLMESRPAEHVDIGGLIYFIGIASAIVPIRSYDFQPVHIPLPGVTTGHADLTKLPFKDGEIKSLSCMHVMEHIGLGRYSDPLDVQGDLKAASELKRVLAPGGQLLIVLPLIGKPVIEFNAHRLYSYDQVLEMFSGLKLKEFTLIECPEYLRNADPNRARRLTGEGAGCFWFVKEQCI